MRALFGGLVSCLKLNLEDIEDALIPKELD